MSDEYQEQLRIEASEIEFSIKRAEKAEEDLKESQRREEEERRQKEEERRQKELLKKKLIASGMTEDEIQKMLNG